MYRQVAAAVVDEQRPGDIDQGGGEEYAQQVCVQRKVKCGPKETSRTRGVPSQGLHGHGRWVICVCSCVCACMLHMGTVTVSDG